MTNVTNKDAVYAFSHSTLLKALAEWEKTQIKDFPNQSEKIQTTVIAMQYFMQSAEIRDNKMLVSGDNSDFIIEKPVTLDKWKTPKKGNK